MFATKEGERLYLHSWNYNALLILDELARIVEERGGRVKPAKTAVITNRTLSGGIRDLSERIELLREVNGKQGSNPAREKAIAESEAGLEELKKIDNEPIEVRGQSWIRFIYDGHMYYYSIDDNPFFDFHYTKTPVNDGEYSLDACLECDTKEWFLDKHMSFRCSRYDLHAAAEWIFRMLTDSQDCAIMRSWRRIRVPNTYDHGFHYEKIYDKERKGKVDF